jgi:membrane associated rhomboid family serine protease
MAAPFVKSLLWFRDSPAEPDLAINMYILYQFGRQVHRDLGTPCFLFCLFCPCVRSSSPSLFEGRERFLTLYGAGIVAGSVGSLAWK